MSKIELSQCCEKRMLIEKQAIWGRYILTQEVNKSIKVFASNNDVMIEKELEDITKMVNFELEPKSKSKKYVLASAHKLIDFLNSPDYEHRTVKIERENTIPFKEMIILGTDIIAYTPKKVVRVFSLQGDKPTKEYLRIIANEVQFEFDKDWTTHQLGEKLISFINEMDLSSKPSVAQVKLYLAKWDKLEKYVAHENALNKLFKELMPFNQNINDVLIKCATLNDFYSTNIFSIYDVAKHILNIPNIDERLANKDMTLVNKIQDVKIDGKSKKFYSFATKYCSHHYPNEFPIYDSYVRDILLAFNEEYKFTALDKNEDKNKDEDKEKNL